MLAFAGCAERDPVAPAAALAIARSQAPQRHIILFRGEGDAPADFAARVAALGGSLEVTSKAGLAVVSGLTEAAASKLGRGSEIAFIEPDVRVQLEPLGRMVGAAPDAAIMSPTNPAGAFFYPFQWDKRQIEVDDVWAASAYPHRFGSPQVRVAILDTGIDSMMFDLRGLIDLDNSVSFITSDAVVANTYFPGVVRPAWNDLNGHGTHVANTVASRGFVTAGMTSQTKLIAVKVLNVDGAGSLGGILAGVAYAADVEADVINMSLGTMFEKRFGKGLHSIFNRVLNYAHRKGSLIVVAAGNSATDMDRDRDGYNAFCDTPHVICVSATGPSVGNFSNPSVFPAGTDFDELAFFSNFGQSAVDVAAPGGNYTTDENHVPESGGLIWHACATNTLFPVPNSNPRTYFPIGCGITSILGFAGTSQAAPQVSGLAAILVAEMGADQPDAVKQRILASADDLGSVGPDPAYGRGRINAARATGVK
jgi:subtilisin family serine protease